MGLAQRFQVLSHPSAIPDKIQFPINPSPRPMTTKLFPALLVAALSVILSPVVAAQAPKPELRAALAATQRVGGAFDAVFIAPASAVAGQ